MKRFTFALVASVVLMFVSYSQAQLPLKGNNNGPLPKPPLKIAPTPPTPQPGAFNGYVNGRVSLVEYDDIRQGSVAPGKKGSGSFKVVGSTIDLKSNLADLWNLNRAAQQSQIADMLKAPIDGHRLYNAQITVATATAKNYLYMSITPSGKQLAIHYFIPGNKITCQADVKWWPDPTVNITFDLDLTMVLQTNGSTSNPVVLKSATLYVSNAKVLVNSDRNAGAEKTINAMSVDVRSKLQPAITLLNSGKLQPFTSKGYGIVTPTHTLPGVSTGSDLILELSRQPLAISSK